MIKFRYFLFIVFVCFVILFVFFYKSTKFEIVEVNQQFNRKNVTSDQRNLYYWKANEMAEFIGFWAVIDDSFMVKNDSGWLEKIVVHPVNTSVFKNDLEVLKLGESNGISFRNLDSNTSGGIEMIDIKDKKEIDTSKPVFIVISAINKEDNIPEQPGTPDFVKKRYKEIKNERLNFYKILYRKFSLTKIGKVAIFVEIRQ